MSLEDPFFVVKDEVLKALLKTRDLYERWKSGEEGRDLRSAEEQEWSATELRNSLRSIEWDLEDLDDTVQIVEKNPAKFKIDATELAVRKQFIETTRREVKKMKDRTTQQQQQPQPNDRLTSQGMDNVSLVSPSVKKPQNGGGGGGGGGSTKYSRLANDDDSPIRTQLQAQQQIVSQQDAQLNIMSDSVGNLRNMSATIGNELDEQAVMLDEFGTEIENAESKLDATMRKMAKVLHMSNDRRQWMAIGALSSAMIVLLLMLFTL